MYNLQYRTNFGHLPPPFFLFFLEPPTVENLNVTSITETSVTLSWNNFVGNQNFYQIRTDADNPTKETWNKSLEFDGLSSGTCYNFTVITGVKDRSMWSEAASVAQCTGEFISLFTQITCSKSS